MDKTHFKNIIVILTMIILLNTMFIPFMLPGNEVKASSIEKNDIYTGLGLMFLMVVLGSGKDNNQKAAHDNFYNYKNFDAEEMEILASIINAEARGESYEGKVAVGAVIINRVYHPSFPNSIRDVVFQSGQFTPVENGMINLSPNNDAFKAAYDAVSGIDPSKGSLYFYNPAKSRNPDFFAGRTKMVTIDNHVFLK